MRVVNKFKYKFIVDGDEYEPMSYDQFLSKPKLMKAVGDIDRRRLFLGLTVHSYSVDYLADHKDVKERYEWLYKDCRLNKLKYFAPNSAEQLAFINDWKEHDIVALVAPNRVGKTTTGVVKALLGGLLKLDPEWPIFKEHGVQYVPFKGEDRVLTFGFGSYEWSHIKTVVWPRVREYVPDEQLGVYSKQLQATRGRPRKDPNFDRSPSVELGTGTILKFHAYSQSQANYESAAYDGFLYDEQPPEPIFNAIDERTRTLRGKHFFTLTPHKVEGRPDTGGGGWLQKFLTGDEKKGHSISCYNTSLADVPDWIYPETEKHKAMEKWIHEPTRLRNIKMLREGRSRMLGEWHKTSGLVIDEWDRRVHIIDDFDVPEGWTRYRALDHGVTNPTVCLWLAVSPPKGDWGSDIIVYREFYSQGKTINENCTDIIKASGNMRRRYATTENARSGMSMAMFEEIQQREFYAKTVLDSRSFGSTDTHTGKPYGFIYKACGLPCGPASGKNSQHWVPILKELFAPSYDLDHAYNKKEMGRPHLMIFRSCVNLVRELEGWVWEEYRSGGDNKNRKESPRKLNDHGCTALGYACQIPLRYRGDVYRPSASTSADEGYGGVYTSMEESNDGEYRGMG